MCGFISAVALVRPSKKVAEVKVTAHSHGEEARELPIVCVVARHPGYAQATDQVEP